MNRRQQKGYDLATQGALARDGVYWRVPSQSGHGSYTVDVESTPPTCTCPDYELSGLKCKHLYAVEYTLACEAVGIAPAEDAAKKKVRKLPRPTYSQDWPAYNAAQVSEKAHFQDFLHALCAGVEEPAYTFGRPRLPLGDMVFAAAYKVYSTVSARRFMTDLSEAQGKGYLSRLPCYNSIFTYLELPELTPILRSLIVQSSLPLKSIETQFAIDSTGFTTCRYVRWYDAKYGQEMERHDWMKAHLMCGVTTNIVTAVEITGGYGADYPQFAPLVETTARHFPLYEVSADKAYLGRDNLELVDRKGGRAYIPFKPTSTGTYRSEDVWDRFYYFFLLHRETFLEHYHRRSVIESTVWMIKAKFGDALRSKGDVAQVNELLCKVLCHNLCVLIQSMYELGIEPQF